MTIQNEALFRREGGRESAGPVQCLGLTFGDDHERRAYFNGLLRDKLEDPEFRAIEGFPVGEAEDILALSDPPYYTACPNPWVADLVALWGARYDAGTDQYQREPFAADVSEGKNDPIYNAHSYHTKVPHRAIMRYILHYTEPGDIVFDGFCGPGMTAVAAQLCGDRKTVESLGYEVKSDGTILDKTGVVFSRLGARRAVLNDLSPAATFIAYNYNAPIDVDDFEREAKRILEEVQREQGWMYLTLCNPTHDQVEEAVSLLRDGVDQLKERAPHLPWGTLNFTVWSDVFLCPQCGAEIVFWDAAVDREAQAVRDDIPCAQCGALSTKSGLSIATSTVMDNALDEPVLTAKQAPVLIDCSRSGKRLRKSPDAFDITLAAEADRSENAYRFPRSRLPEGDESRRNDRRGITHVHHYYTRRNLLALAAIKDRLSRADPRYLSWFSATLSWAGKENRLHLGNFFKGGGGVITSLRGTWYVASLQVETNVLERMRLRMRSQKFRSTLNEGLCAIGTASASTSLLPPCGCDYVFTDPPFGGNLMYSDLNCVLEAWLGVSTDNRPEAVESRAQRKTIVEYQHLMEECFLQYERALKPGRWMTVEFHNSRNAVWMAIQEALQRAGLVVADVRTLDKGKGSFKQVNSAGSVKQDLVISAYKPRADTEHRFEIEAGTQDGVWTFIRGHLAQLPVAVQVVDGLEAVAERQAFLLYDRMVAFHVQRGVQLPLSAAGFYSGLEERFACRDAMYFLPDQVAEYDRKRMQAQEVRQLELFVTDEESAIQWLRRVLSDRPLTFQDLHPLFMREIAGWEKHERPLELVELLDENFLRYDGEGEVPSQIHAYLSSNYREMRGLDKWSALLRAKAKDRWFVPDARKAGDLEQLRERALLKEFDDDAAGRGKLKLFRIEAVRAGFKRAWQEHDYQTIIDVAERLPADVLQEDAKLLMWYDQALTRAGE